MQAQHTYDHLLRGDAFHQNPHAAFKKLRDNAPVYWSDHWKAWVITRYDDVMRVMQQPDAFSSAGRVSYLLDSLAPDIRNTLTRLEQHYQIGLAHTDPPDHTRLRSLLNKVFTPRMVATWRPRIEQVSHGLIDAMLEQAQPDIIRDVAHPLPATIIAEMIGAKTDDIHLFRDWAVDINNLFAGGGRMSETAATQAQQSLVTMREYIMALVAEREHTPQDDIIGRLVAADEKLTIDELVSTCVTLFVAGHETTTNLIGNGIYLLLQHRDQMNQLRDNPDLIGTALEEILRYEPSVPRAWRIVREETVLNGQTITAGSLIFPMLSAANRDPDVFPDPDRFDITRENNKQLAFGYGIHFCLGAPLARLEGAIAIPALLDRLPQMQLIGDAQWLPDVAIRSLQRLPVIT